MSVAVCVLVSLHAGLYKKCHFGANWNRVGSPLYLKNKVKRKVGDLVADFTAFRYRY